MATPVDANYVRARAGLLDPLAALGSLRDAAVLVGARAIHEYTRDHAGDYAVAPFTFDADLALIPELLVDDPKVIDAMQNAGYGLTDQPGIYRRDDGVQVDLLVPEAVGGRTGRGAELGVHGNRAARQVRGLEGALVSRRPVTVRTLVAADDRAYEINVAGPAALLVAKVRKLLDRINADDNRRIDSKDASTFSGYCRRSTPWNWSTRLTSLRLRRFGRQGIRRPETGVVGQVLRVGDAAPHQQPMSLIRLRPGL